MSTLPPHGRVACTICFPENQAVKPWGHPECRWPGWQLTHNPLAWGSQTPEVLVLGFSKGVNQNAEILTRQHEDIPFRRGRHNLTKILHALGLLADGEPVDARFSADEKFFAFGSLLRCSIAMEDPATGRLIMSGRDVMPKAVNDTLARKVFDNCAGQFLARLPQSLRLVVMLGNHHEYVAGCREIVGKAHPSLRGVNAVAYRTGGITWVHTVHFAAQGRLVPEWCGVHGPCKQRDKGESARAVVRELGFGPRSATSAPGRVSRDPDDVPGSLF